MSTETSILAIRLKGPMQSWGFNSQFNRRDTSLFPTKSAIAGMCCAAMGFARGSAEEEHALQKFGDTKLTCIAIPQERRGGELAIKRIQDYQTVQNTRGAKGGTKSDAVLTYRQYLNDAGFIVLLYGDKDFISQIAECLKNPVWGVWFGRKACIPSAPVFAGVYTSEMDAIANISEFKGKKITDFSRVVEVNSFNEGIDTYMDQPVSFDLKGRKFAPRRVMLKDAII